jgi:hypothetical protein
MAMYNKGVNQYHLNPKRSDIRTPPAVAERIHELAPLLWEPAVVFDPAIGAGALTRPFQRDGARVVGCDIIDDDSGAERFFRCGIEAFEWPQDEPRPSLVIMNPPFNQGGGKTMYPEVFLRRIDALFGNHIPTVMIVPMGFRLNQSWGSKRWRYIRDRWAITGILALPLDAFPGCKFHTEVLFFNIRDIPPHSFMRDPTCSTTSARRFASAILSQSQEHAAAAAQ